MDLCSRNPRTRQIVQRADECLGYSLSKIMAGYPPGDLDQTRHTQPAIFVHSVALYEEIRNTFEALPVAVAGHSLGEYSALYAAGALDFESALRLIQIRATGMEKAQPSGTCGMAALLGISAERVLELVEIHREDDVLEVANYNAPDQTVVSGHKPAVSRIVAAAGNEKRARAVMLNVSSAFHTSLMEPALESLYLALMQTKIREPNFPVVANIDAKFYPHADLEMRERLINQVVRPVLWDDCVKTMIQSGAQTFIEVGPGKVLTGLLRRINKQARGINLSDTETLESLESALVA